jgi:hypothetical protein
MTGNAHPANKNKKARSPVAKTTVPSINPKVAGSNPAAANCRVAQSG